MLIGFAAGTFPSKWTIPRTLDVVVGAAPPAFTRCGTEIQIANATAANDKTFLTLIGLHLKLENLPQGGTTLCER